MPNFTLIGLYRHLCSRKELQKTRHLPKFHVWGSCTRPFPDQSHFTTLRKVVNQCCC